jgi:hypothetical protein
MSLKPTSAKLVSLIQENAEELAKKWLKDVNENTKTPSYHEFVDKVVRYFDRAIYFTIIGYENTGT